MGSDAKAVLPGFICRLCSHPKKFVIHIYSSRGKKLNLLHKLAFVPISVHRFDRLPKTICSDCIKSLDNQYNLITQIRKNIRLQQYMHICIFHTQGDCPSECPLNASRRSDSSTPRSPEPGGSSGSSSIL